MYQNLTAHAITLRIKSALNGSAGFEYAAASVHHTAKADGGQTCWISLMARFNDGTPEGKMFTVVDSQDPLPKLVARLVVLVDKYQAARPVKTLAAAR